MGPTTNCSLYEQMLHAVFNWLVPHFPLSRPYLLCFAALNPKPLNPNLPQVGGGPYHQLQLVRADAARCVQLDLEETAAREGAIRQAAGFAAVMELMRKCGKPAVGHNLMFDLAYMLYG